jgi:hypothetical protein
MRAMRCFMTVCPHHDWPGRLFLPSRRVGVSTKEYSENWLSYLYFPINRVPRFKQWPRIKKHHRVFFVSPQMPVSTKFSPKFRTPM